VVHRVVKRTPKHIYVAAAPERGNAPTSQWANVDAVLGREATLRLNRAELEQEGYAFVSLADAERFALEEPLFYTTPYPARAGESFGREECFALLELTPPYTVAAVKQAYRRLALQHHPDRGGSATRFHALQVAYRQALVLLGA
jgi:hypothetical protein